MPRANSGYARIAQAEEEEDDDGDEYRDNSDDDTPRTISTAKNLRYEPIQPGPIDRMHPTSSGPTINHNRRPGRRRRANSGIDIKAINARLERWADEIASKFKIRKIKGKSPEEEKLEIHHSVFQAPEGMRPANAEDLTAQSNHAPTDRMSKLEFDDVIETVRVAIELGSHPKLVSQGSSGSYFCGNTDGNIVGIFKPKDEEPYASKNPKWTKWIHRNLFPCFFGRACLIPNLSYVSEAAAYVLDTRLQTYVVPYTDVVYFSSISFNYDFWDRRAYYRKKQALPQKAGSFQVFLKGFQDANLFLKSNPWPDQSDSMQRSETSNQRRRWAEECRPGRTGQSDDEAEEYLQTAQNGSRTPKSIWTPSLQQSFREELEKLVILDYIMRNTDRGLDNWMIRIDEATQKATLVADVPKFDDIDQARDHSPYKREDPMSTARPDSTAPSSASLGAIDNSLAWPWKHPDAWRSFPFGWLFLPVSMIGQPFSERTRNHFLPLLTSKQWWSDTQVALRNCFSQDSDFQERMFARQIAVMKGQAWNVVETLKTPNHGPLELCRRARVCVWDDLVDIPVVLPMRAPSNEMRRQQDESQGRAAPQEEMDISAARSHLTPAEATFPTSRPTSAKGIPSPARFSLSRHGSNEEEDISNHSNTGGFSFTGTAHASLANAQARHDASHLRSSRPPGSRIRANYSFDEPRPYQQRRLDRKRNLSFSARPISNHASDDDGDLGYAAARDMEGNHKRVIVERLETVKSKNPVFTWC